MSSFLDPGGNEASRCVSRFGNGYTVAGDLEESFHVLFAQVMRSPGDQE